MTDLGTVQGFAERRGVDFDPTDLRAIRAIQDASAFIRAYTRRQITTVTDETVTLNGSGRDRLVLPEFPVVSVTEVKTLDDDGVETVLETTDYRVDASGILGRIDGWVWPSGIANVVVTYDHGYDTVPADIAAACYELAATNYQSTGGGTVTQESIGSYSVTYDAATVAGAELPELVKAILDNYRMPQ